MMEDRMRQIPSRAVKHQEKQRQQQQQQQQQRKQHVGKGTMKRGDIGRPVPPHAAKKETIKRNLKPKKDSRNPPKSLPPKSLPRPKYLPSERRRKQHAVVGRATDKGARGNGKLTGKSKRAGKRKGMGKGRGKGSTRRVDANSEGSSQDSMELESPSHLTQRGAENFASGENFSNGRVLAEYRDSQNAVTRYPKQRKPKNFAGKENLHNEAELGEEDLWAPKDVVTTRPQARRADDKILLVGEGNFSFSAELAERSLWNPAYIVATSYDSETDLLQKYSEKAYSVEHYLEKLSTHKVNVEFNVDATDLEKCGRIIFGERPYFDIIQFNFPHAGQRDEVDAVHLHQELVYKFFLSARNVLWHTHGCIRLTLLKPQFKAWKVDKFASLSGFNHVGETRFESNYVTVWGDARQIVREKPPSQCYGKKRLAYTYVFQVKPGEEDVIYEFDRSMLD